jgi:uncharacterized damage-inducible protein DinB
MNPSLEELRYPIGQAQTKEYSEEQKRQWLNDIKFAPQLLESAVHNLDEQQLQTPYREGGWTVHQTVHHVADSHINAYCRFKLALTEDTPTIKPYEEALWAELSDTRNLPVNISLTLLHALHARLYELLKNLNEDDWKKKIYHPEQKKEITLWELLGSYAWHGRHHAAHINSLRERMNWK